MCIARGNLYWTRVLDLSSKPKTSRFNFLLDLKAQSTLHEKNIPCVEDYLIDPEYPVEAYL